MKLIYLTLLFCVVTMTTILLTTTLFAMDEEQAPVHQTIMDDDAQEMIRLLKPTLDSLPSFYRKQTLLNALAKKAFFNNKERTLRELIIQGANPDAIIDEVGSTMLMRIPLGPHIGEFLLNNGASPSMYNRHGHSALHHCMIPSTNTAVLQSVRMLIEQVGIDYPIQNTNRSLLTLAAQQTDRCQLLAFLLDNHADPNNNRSLYPETPLTDALLAIKTPGKYAHECPYKTAQLLYTYGAEKKRYALWVFLSPARILNLYKERARRVADCAFLDTLYSAEQQRAQPFSQSYNNAQKDLISTTLQALLTKKKKKKKIKNIVDLIADYAAYDPVHDNYSRDTPSPALSTSQYTRSCGTCSIQ